jgi:predicted O-methyltransferase YrrM
MWSLILLDNMRNDQNDKLLKLNLPSRDDCINLLNTKLSEPFGSTRRISNEHLIILVAISIKFKNSIKNILEIGTYEADTTSVMSVLFPNANIVTIDLPEDELELFAFNKYRNDTLTTTKKTQIPGFRENRIELIKSLHNVKYIETNSINLTNWDSNQFDLIWVDGNHEYPISCIDIINSYRLLTSNGIMLLDDVHINNKLNYIDDSIYETLLTLQKSKLLKTFELFYKKIEVESFSKNQKYVGYVTK